MKTPASGADGPGFDREIDRITRGRDRDADLRRENVDLGRVVRAEEAGLAVGDTHEHALLQVLRRMVMAAGEDALETAADDEDLVLLVREDVDLLRGGGGHGPDPGQILVGRGRDSR